MVERRISRPPAGGYVNAAGAVNNVAARNHANRETLEANDDASDKPDEQHYEAPQVAT